jgi:nucleotide-binding universal stress UspA family protein
MYRHILIPTDGSPLAEKGVHEGIALAKQLGARITALIVDAPFNVHDMPQTRVAHLSEAYEQLAKQGKQEARNALDRVAEAAKAGGVSCETVEVEHDRPSAAIVEIAKSRGCDLIVIASHGRSGLPGLLLGSVTNKVLNQAGIPVLVCR